MDKFYESIKLMGYSLKHIKSLQVIGDSAVLSMFDMGDIIESIDKEIPPYTLNDGWSQGGLSILYSAANHYGSEGEYMAAIDKDELVALCVFSYYTLGLFDLKNYWGNDPAQHPVEKNTEAIYVNWLAGKGKGGGVTLIHELMQIAEAENKVLFLQSTDGAVDFYRKVGFTETTNIRMHFYWLPSSLRE